MLQQSVGIMPESASGPDGRVQRVARPLGLVADVAKVDNVDFPPDEFEVWRHGDEVDMPTCVLPGTESWVDHIINGSALEDETDVTKAKKALAMLAGSPFLDDAEVMARYRDVQFKASKSNAAVFEEGMEGRVDTPLVKSVDLRFSVGTACSEYKDPDVFFPEGGKNRNKTVLRAKRVCHICIKRSECVDSSLSGSDRGGIAGALSVNQRRKVRKIKAKRGPEAMQVAIEAMWSEDLEKIGKAIEAGSLED